MIQKIKFVDVRGLSEIQPLDFEMFIRYIHHIDVYILPVYVNLVTNHDVFCHVLR